MIEISNPTELCPAPAVSVVMLAYNHQDYIEQAIEGVLAQACDAPLELIVAEDCSSDATRATAEKYVHSHPHSVRVITDAKNVGMMPNLFRALRLCRGQFIAFCEGDDWWCDVEKVAAQLEFFDNPKVGMVHTNYSTCSLVERVWTVSDKGFHDRRPEADLRGNVFGVNLRQLMPRTCTTIYRREVIEGFLSSDLCNRNYAVGDVPMVLFCAANWEIEYLDRITSVYRIAPNSVTRSGMGGTARIMEGLSAIHADLETLYGDRPDFDKRALLPFCVSHAKAAFRLGDSMAFKRALIRLEQVSPGSSKSPGLLARRAIVASPRLLRFSNRVIDGFRRLSIG